jgi:predicted O-linked N-acetylglucosamine transferase (SPINDLY family)
LAVAVAENDAFQRALSALQKGNVKDAERLLKVVLRKHPRHVAALNVFGIVLTQLGRFAEAETYLLLAMKEHAHSDATLYNYGIVLKALNRPAEALDRFTQALAINSTAAETWNNRGTVFNDLKRHEEAIEDFKRAIQINPRYAEAFCNKGKTLTLLKHLPEALADFERALTLKPNLPEAWLGRGTICYERQRYEEALADYSNALTLKPELVEAWLGHGNTFYALKRYGEAVVSYQKALALKPDVIETWLSYGNTAYELKRYEEALAAYDRALALDSNYAVAHSNRGNVLLSLRRYSEAIAAFDAALLANPSLARPWLGRGIILAHLKRYDEAFGAYDRASALTPDLPEVWIGRGDLLTALKRYEDAFAAYEQALLLGPDCAEAWLGRGNVLSEVRRYDEASAAYERALTLKPDLAEAWLGRGKVLAELRRQADAFAAYDRAAALKPDLDYAAAARLSSKLQLCDWTDFDADVAQLLSTIRQRNVLSVPFSILPIPSSAADQLQCARRQAKEQPAFPQIWNGQAYSHERIRVAYLSADFRDHPVAALIAGLLERHDKSRFEITGISFGSGRDSAMGSRIESACEHFVDMQDKSDQDIAELVRRREIDIVVDLMGYTQHARPGVFARRPAPIQVNYLGYAGTMGADFIDYIIADRIVIPEQQFEFYSEKIVWLPDSFMVNDSARDIAQRTPTRTELGLPEKAFVFCCFNQSFKIGPAIFDIWMRLLREIDGSVLWLKDNSAAATQNLRLEAERRGVPSARLVFAPPVPLVADHLARHRQADLFLDTLFYNAHASASDALWTGLPVVTCLGSTFAGRVAASLLHAVGLPELVAESLPDYEDLALKLAREPSFLVSLKSKLARHRSTHPLFDNRRFTRHIESAYSTMLQAHRRGESGKSFAVKASD